MRCSSTYNLERKLDECQSREEDLTSQIAELKEVSSRSQRTTVDLFRVLRCQKSLKELKSDASAEEYIDKAWLVTESIKAIATEMSPEAGSKLFQAGISSQRGSARIQYSKKR